MLPTPHPPQSTEEQLFLKAVSLCHTVQINYEEPDCVRDSFHHANGVSLQMEYYASSPDEKALVEAMKRWGCTCKLRACCLATKNSYAPLPAYLEAWLACKSSVQLEATATLRN